MKYIYQSILRHPTFWTVERMPKLVREFVRRPLVRLHLKALLQFERMSPEAIYNFQCRQLARILRHAYQNVPFWRQWLAPIKAAIAKTDPISMRQQMAEHIEVLTKDIFRSLPVDELRCRGLTAKRSRDVSTSGSTGRPLTFLHDAHSLDRANAQYFRAPVWFGISAPFFVRICFRDFYYAPGDGAFIEVFKPDALREKLAVLDGLDGATPGRTPVVHSYPSYFLALAGLASQNKFVANFKFGISSGENLSPEIKKYISEELGIPISNTYGMREARSIASECPEGSLHIYADSFLIEVVDEAGKPLPDGRWGRIIVTDFNNFVMPLIRYDSGDLGRMIPEICPCGIALPIIKLEGRSSELISLPDGRTIHPFTFLAPFNSRVERVWQFQVVRDETARFTAYVVPGVGFTPQDSETIQKELQDILGVVANIRVELVKSIAAINGKISHYLSKVKA